MQSSQPSQCAAVDGMDGRRRLYAQPSERHSFSSRARSRKREGRKEEEESEGREGKSRQRRSLELTSHNERERELGKLDAAAHHSCHALLAGLGGESERL